MFNIIKHELIIRLQNVNTATLQGEAGVFENICQTH